MIALIIFAVLTALAAMAVIWPYASGSAEGGRDGGSDTLVYKDQLEEIERDLNRGVLNEDEAESARLETARRLLKAADQDAATPTRSPPRRWRSGLVLGVAFVVVPLLSVTLYASFGAPGMPDRPLAERLQASVENQDAAILIARVEQAVADDPDDVRGWAILAPIYARQGRYFDARRSYENLLRLAGQDPGLLTDLGEVIVVENQGLVTEEALTRFQAALTVNPSFPKARYYTALALVQEGRLQEAEVALTLLLSEGGPDAPWAQSVADLLANMDAAADMAALRPSPGADAIEAIANLPEAERRAAIEGMVEGLAQRLSQQPDDLAGWSQLIRSYVTLGQRAEAQRSLLTALDVFRTDNPARLRLLTIAEELQLNPTP